MKARPGKPTRTADEIRSEINGRLRSSGHAVTVGSPRPAAGVFVAGRNWELDPPSDLAATDRDAFITTVRLVGNEVDCAWRARRRRPLTPNAIPSA